MSLRTQEDSRDGARQGLALGAVMLSFGALGFFGSIAGTLVPAVREVFGLGLSAAMTVQWIALVGVGISSIPLTHLMLRIGFARMAILALAVSFVGCLAVAVILMPQIVGTPSYGLFLTALLVLSIGTTALQMSINPLATMLGDARFAASRITVSQGINSIGLLLAVVLSSFLILAHTGIGTEDARSHLISGMAATYLVCAFLTGGVLIFAVSALKTVSASPAKPSLAPGKSLACVLRDRWAMAGSLTIAAYVGAEGAIGAMLTSYLHQPQVLDLSMKVAGILFAAVYCGGMMAGRLLGGILMRTWRSAWLLICVTLAAAACCVVVVAGSGLTAGVAILLIGPLNAIMFPVVFSTTLERSSAPSSVVSGMLVLATSGGAAVSALAGWVGERHGVSAAFAIPLCAYLIVTHFAYRAIQVD